LDLNNKFDQLDRERPVFVQLNLDNHAVSAGGYAMFKSIPETATGPDGVITCTTGVCQVKGPGTFAMFASVDCYVKEGLEYFKGMILRWEIDDAKPKTGLGLVYDTFSHTDQPIAYSVKKFADEQLHSVRLSVNIHGSAPCIIDGDFSVFYIQKIA